MSDISNELPRNRYAQAALSTKLQQPKLGQVAQVLCDMDEERYQRTGKRMTDDHLRQEARSAERIAETFADILRHAFKRMYGV